MSRQKEQQEIIINGFRRMNFQWLEWHCSMSFMQQQQHTHTHTHTKGVGGGDVGGELGGGGEFYRESYTTQAQKQTKLSKAIIIQTITCTVHLLQKHALQTSQLTHTDKFFKIENFRK